MAATLFTKPAGLNLPPLWPKLRKNTKPANRKNQIIDEFLKRKKIPHQVLNAKNHEKEAQIIAQAGRFKAVTVATNMAGRGVDIILGGDPEGREKPDWQKEHEQVVKAGGLHV